MIEQEYKILLDYEQYYKLIKMLPFSEKRIQKIITTILVIFIFQIEALRLELGALTDYYQNCKLNSY